ncbi:MAG: hypothetical protein ACLUGP_08040 [Faecalibacterium prausnitzii]
MNRNLNEAIYDIAKVEAIMFSFENTYLELDVAPADRARADMATDASMPSGTPSGRCRMTSTVWLEIAEWWMPSTPSMTFGGVLAP